MTDLMPEPEAALYRALLDAARLRPGLRMGYVKDMHWLFTLRLREWARSRGAAVRDRLPGGLSTRLDNDGVTVFDATLGRFNTRVEAHPVKTIDAAFCVRYGFGDYSWGALNSGHEHWDGINDKQLLPGRLVQPGPMLLGSFAVVMAGPLPADVPALPGALHCVARAQWPLGKTQSVWAWLGVWVDGDALPPALKQQIQALPPQDLGRPIDELGKRHSPWFGRKVALHYGKPGDDEAALRAALGFKPKSKPVSEEILYHSACEIFGADAVKRHYRGRELQGLELDIWVPALRLGFEYQGEQHTRHVKLWHGEDGLERQQERDKRKKQLCKQLGYRVFFFHPNEWLNKESVLDKLRRDAALTPEFAPGESERSREAANDD